MTIDYHATQLTGTTCAPRNCAAASAAMVIYDATAGGVVLTTDDVRRLSGRSCVPGVDSPSGGLYISDVIRVCALYSVAIDYGVNPITGYTRWLAEELQRRLASGWSVVLLGDYDALPSRYRASATFLGDHSTKAHDYRTDLVPYGGTVAGPTVCWHDPLRVRPIRIPLSAAVAYWQKPTSPIRGFAGWVKDTRPQEEADPLMKLPIASSTPVLVALTTGDQIYNPDGSALVRMSGPYKVVSPYAVKLGTVAHRVLPITTRGVTYLALVKLADVTTTAVPAADTAAAFNEGRDAVLVAGATVPRR